MRSFVGFFFILGTIGCIGACSGGSSRGGGGGTDDAGAGGAPDSDGQLDHGGAAGDAGSDEEQADCRIWGVVDTNQTWGPVDECPDGFDVTQTIWVSGSGTVLTIKPGTKLKFQADAMLVVEAGAALAAAGTEQEPIVFTGWEAQPGAWGGIVFHSTALSNEISHAIVEYGGTPEGASGNVSLSSNGGGRIKLTSTTLRHGGRFGLAVLDGASFSEFSNNKITDNQEGAARVQVTTVHQLAGKGNTFADNGRDNTVWVEARGLSVTGDVTWPNLAPAIYRVEDAALGVHLDGHLSIEAGSVIEFTGASGVFVDGGAAGLSAIGTEEEPIIFRGVGGSRWGGIAFCQTNWSGNALEHVEIYDARGPYEWDVCGAGGIPPAVYVGHIQSSRPSRLRIKNINVTATDENAVDVVVLEPSELVNEGGHTGSAPGGSLKIVAYR